MAGEIAAPISLPAIPSPAAGVGAQVIGAGLGEAPFIKQQFDEQQAALDAAKFQQGMQRFQFLSQLGATNPDKWSADPQYQAAIEKWAQDIGVPAPFVEGPQGRRVDFQALGVHSAWQTALQTPGNWAAFQSYAPGPGRDAFAQAVLGIDPNTLPDNVRNIRQKSQLTSAEGTAIIQDVFKSVQSIAGGSGTVANVMDYLSSMQQTLDGIFGDNFTDGLVSRLSPELAKAAQAKLNLMAQQGVALGAHAQDYLAQVGAIHSVADYNRARTNLTNVEAQMLPALDTAKIGLMSKQGDALVARASADRLRAQAAMGTGNLKIAQASIGLLQNHMNGLQKSYAANDAQLTRLQGQLAMGVFAPDSPGYAQAQTDVATLQNANNNIQNELQQSNDVYNQLTGGTMRAGAAAGMPGFSGMGGFTFAPVFAPQTGAGPGVGAVPGATPQSGPLEVMPANVRPIAGSTKTQSGIVWQLASDNKYYADHYAPASTSVARPAPRTSTTTTNHAPSKTPPAPTAKPYPGEYYAKVYVDNANAGYTVDELRQWAEKNVPKQFFAQFKKALTDEHGIQYGM
jgi:hypothetical protein